MQIGRTSDVILKCDLLMFAVIIALNGLVRGQMLDEI